MKMSDKCYVLALIMGASGLMLLAHFSLSLFGAVICLYLAKASAELGESSEKQEAKK